MTDQKLEEIERAIENYKALNLKVAITELDLTIAGQDGGTTDGRRARPRPCFWGLNDRRSWRAGQSPLIFDGENQAKPALQAIASAAVR